MPFFALVRQERKKTCLEISWCWQEYPRDNHRLLLLLEHFLRYGSRPAAIAGFQCHAIQNKSKSKSKPLNRLSPESETRKKATMPRFRSQQFFLCKICGEAGGRKLKKAFVTEFCYKSVSLSLKELRKNKIILSPIQELFRWPNSPKYIAWVPK